MFFFLHIYIASSTSSLTFVAWAQNYVKWAEFNTNHFVEYKVANGNSYKKKNYKASNTFV